jgi:hypothetical protein
MVERPSIDRLDIAAFAAAAGLLVFAYVVYPDQILQYGVWIAVFIIWMVWFTYYGTKWLYSVESTGE